MFNLMDKKIFAILRKLFLLNWPYLVLRKSRQHLVTKDCSSSVLLLESLRICKFDNMKLVKCTSFIIFCLFILCDCAPMKVRSLMFHNF